MDSKIVELIVEARFLVGFLGEKEQSNWWGSSFLSKPSSAFLTPVFPKTTKIAQFHGISEAAKRVHDEHIGLGRNYHLYRLPDSIERSLANTLSDTNVAASILENISDSDTAMFSLSKLCTKSDEMEEGPIAVGDFSDDKLGELVKQSLSHYLRAFQNDLKCFPYMRDSS